MDPKVEQSGSVSVNDCGSDDDNEIATSLSGFGASEQQRTENLKRSLTELNCMDSDTIGRKFYRAQPVNLTTPPDAKNPDNVEGPPAAAAAARRSQYHSIQQLSQSGRPGDGCGRGGLFSSAEAGVYGQAWLGCGGAECEEDTLQVVRRLLRRYDRCAAEEPRGLTAAAGAFDGRGDDSDEVASGTASVSDVSGDDLEDYSQPVTLRRSPVTLRRSLVTFICSPWSPVTLRRSPVTLKCSPVTLKGLTLTWSPVTLRRSPTTTTLQAKRARVEHIVSNIRTPTCPEDAAGATDPACRRASPSSLELHGRTTDDGARRSKRKQTVPQQHDCATFDNEDHPSLNGNASDDVDDNDEDDGDGNDSRMMLVREQADIDEEELRRQLRAVQLRLEDMCVKYSARSLQVDHDLYVTAPRSPDNDMHLEPDTKPTNNEAERLTSLLKAEVKHVVDGLVDGIVKRFLTKHFTGRRPPPPQSPPSTDDRPRLDLPQLSPVTSLPVFPPPPPPPPLFPFPVGGADVLGLRRAYAERCAYVDALVQRARTTRAPDPALNCNDSATSGPTMTSSSSEVVDRRSSSLMSVMTSRCLLPDQQLMQPPTQVYR